MLIDNDHGFVNLNQLICNIFSTVSNKLLNVHELYIVTVRV